MDATPGLLCWMLAAKEDHPWLDSHCHDGCRANVVPGAQPYSRPFIDSKGLSFVISGFLSADGPSILVMHDH